LKIDRILAVAILLIGSSSLNIHLSYAGANGPTLQSLRFEDRLITRKLSGVEFSAATPDIVFSPDGQHVAYLAQISQGQPDAGRWVFVIDDKKTQPFDSRFSTVLFSADSRKFGYSAIRDGRTRIIIDANSVADLTGKVISVAFSSDLNHYAYVVTDHDKNIAVIDGNAVGVDNIREILLSSDGVHYLAIASNHGREYVIQDGNRLKGDFEKVTKLNFSPNSKSVAYSAEDQGQTIVVFDDKTVRVEAGFGINPAWSLLFSDDSTRLMYAAWSKDLRHGFVGVMDKLYTCKYGESFGSAASLAMSPDNQYLFQAPLFTNRMLINGVPQARASGSLVSDAVFSPRGNVVAFTVANGTKQNLATMRIDSDFVFGPRSPEYDFVSKPIFNVDGTKVAFGVLQGNEFWWRTLTIG
jgi:WD40 repeat protein